jgi:hypothetical protein
MTQLEPLQVGGILAVCLLLGQGLIEITKIAITRRLNGSKESIDSIYVSLPEEQKDQLKFLHEIHSRFDEDGAPLWYVPRSLTANQAKMTELLNNMLIHQENQTKVLDKIAEKIK